MELHYWCFGVESLHNILGRGFILSAGSSFLTGPQCFGAEPFEDFSGGGGQGHLILRPSTSRWTPTYFGTSTAGWRSKVTLKVLYITLTMWIP